MATTALQIMTRAGYILNDQAMTTWTDTELLAHINEAILETINVRPDSASVTETVTLAAGTRQTLPAGGIRFIALDRNASGQGIIEEQLAKIQRNNPGWASTPASATIRAYMFSPASPKEYLVFPPSNGAASVVLRYAKQPAALTSNNDTLPLDDVYAGAILNYVLHRATMKEGSGKAQFSGMHFNNFLSSLGLKTRSDLAITPPGAAAGAMPAVAAAEG